MYEVSLLKLSTDLEMHEENGPLVPRYFAPVSFDGDVMRAGKMVNFLTSHFTATCSHPNFAGPAPLPHNK